MDGAAQSVCRDLQRQSLALRHKHAECVNHALRDAVATVDRPAVSAYAAARGIVPEGGALQIARAD
jgi:hypothetical protein